jgi:hypothetical protein
MKYYDIKLLATKKGFWLFTSILFHSLHLIFKILVDMKLCFSENLFKLLMASIGAILYLLSLLFHHNVLHSIIYIERCTNACCGSGQIHEGGLIEGDSIQWPIMTCDACKSKTCVHHKVIIVIYFIFITL